MDIRDTISRVLLGIAFGFVMGIVMYQAAGIDAGVTKAGTLNAQNEDLPLSVPGTLWRVDCLGINGAAGGTCVITTEQLGSYFTQQECEDARATTCVGSSVPFTCDPGNIPCGNILCCVGATHVCQLQPTIQCVPKSAASTSAVSSSNGLCCNTAASTPFCQPI